METAAIIMGIMSALSSMKGAWDQKKLANQARTQGAEQMTWNKIQKTLGQFFPGAMTNQPDVNTPGGLMANSFLQALMHPGALAPVDYVRGQEQANMAQQALSNRGVGQMSQLGMGLTTPLAQTMWGAGPMAGANARNEILRAMLQMQEQKAMQDRAYGAQGIGGMFDFAKAIREARAQLLMGGNKLAMDTPSPWSTLGSGLGGMAAYFGDKAEKKPTATTQDNEGIGSMMGAGVPSYTPSAQSGSFQSSQPGPYASGYQFPSPQPGPYASGYQFPTSSASGSSGSSGSSSSAFETFMNNLFGSHVWGGYGK